MDKIHILLIEDNRLLREGISAMLNDHGDFTVVARSEDGDSILQLKELGKPPDIVLLDLGLEKINSLMLMELIKNEFPSIRVVAMDILPDHTDIVEFVKAGGSGFILKDAPFEDYVKTIKAVASGVKVLPSIMTKSLFNQIIDTSLNLELRQFEESLRLTPREGEIIELISEGLSNKEIAQRLHIATYTVKSHVHNILEKLSLNTRLQISAFAHKNDSK